MTRKIGLFIFAVALSLVLIEGGLRLREYVFFSVQEFENLTSLEKEDVYRILCIGDSLTIGGRESFPRQLERILNEKNLGKKFSVINKGLPGGTTAAVLLNLENDLDKYRPHMVVSMLGFEVRDGEETKTSKGFSIKRSLSFLEQLKIYTLGKTLLLNLLDKLRLWGIIKYFPKEEKIETDRLGDDFEFVKKAKDYRQRGMPQQARVMAEKALEINPKNDQAYFELGQYFREEKDEEKSLAMYEKALEINPENDMAYVGKAQIYREQGRILEAEKLVKKALEINPENSWGYGEYAWLFSNRGNIPKVIEMFNNAIALDTDDENIYFALAGFYRSAGREDEIEALFKKVLQINPKSSRAYAALGSLYKEREEDAMAKEYFSKSYQMSAASFTPESRFGKNYQKIGELIRQRGAKFVCSQYPRSRVALLKAIFRDKKGIIFVDNKDVFDNAVAKDGYDTYFRDVYGGSFGHCTVEGNRILAQNIANTISEVF